MRHSRLEFVLFWTILLFIGMASPGAPAQAPSPVPGPAAEPRLIPGLNAPDPFPRGCVDCHINRREEKLDVRLSTLMRQWNDQVDPRLLARVQHLAPKGVILTGRHPRVADDFRDIPRSCLPCHGKNASEAPAFGPMMHGIHLTGGSSNHYMTLFQGECTFCHKFTPSAGEWSLPSSSER